MQSCCFVLILSVLLEVLQHMSICVFLAGSVIVMIEDINNKTIVKFKDSNTLKPF